MMSFKEALRSKDFVVTAELPLAPDSTRQSLLHDSNILGNGVDGFLLTDNQYGQPHLSPASAAGILLQNGFPPILQLSSRNRNRIALMGELLGARATGIDSLMLVRGGVLPEGYTPRPKAVADTDAKDLIATARTMNADEKFGSSHQFLIGTSAAVHDPAPGAQPEELQAKADAGAQMFITPICLDIDILRRYVEFLIANQLLQRLSAIISIAIVTSAEMATWLQNNRQGTIIPNAFIENLRAAADGETLAVESCAMLVREIATIPGVAGINFVAAGNFQAIPAVLSAAGLAR